MSTAQNGLSISPEQRGQRGGGRGRVEEVKKKVDEGMCGMHIPH